MLLFLYLTGDEPVSTSGAGAVGVDFLLDEVFLDFLDTFGLKKFIHAN